MLLHTSRTARCLSQLPSRGLAIISIVAASLAMYPVPFARELFLRQHPWGGYYHLRAGITLDNAIITGTGRAIVLFVVLLTLTMIESEGLRLVGRRRGWRSDRRLMRTICYHASPAWVVAAVGSAIGALANTWISVGDLPVPFWGNFPGEYVLPVAGFFPGLIWFELISYLGLRQCRYANLAAKHQTTTSEHRPDQAKTPA